LFRARKRRAKRVRRRGRKVVKRRNGVRVEALLKARRARRRKRKEVLLGRRRM
jgi:hypothetical protein